MKKKFTQKNCFQSLCTYQLIIQLHFRFCSIFTRDYQSRFPIGVARWKFTNALKKCILWCYQNFPWNFDALLRRTDPVALFIGVARWKFNKRKKLVFLQKKVIFGHSTRRKQRTFSLCCETTESSFEWKEKKQKKTLSKLTSDFFFSEGNFPIGCLLCEKVHSGNSQAGISYIFNCEALQIIFLRLRHSAQRTFPKTQNELKITHC